MKILLDECVTKKLIRFLPYDLEISTVSQMKWNGYRNGNLLSKAVENNFDLVITIDKNLQYQQNLIKHNIIVVVFNSVSSKVEYLKEFAPHFILKMDSFKKGNVYIISL